MIPVLAAVGRSIRTAVGRISKGWFEDKELEGDGGFGRDSGPPCLKEW